jgi:hypothetical protein
MPGRRLVYLIAWAILGAAAACDSFGGGESGPGSTTPDAAGVDGAGNLQDGSVDDAESADRFVPPPPPQDIFDASVRPAPSEVQSDDLYLTCPPTSTGSKFGSQTATTLVKRPPSGYDYPFGIVTDRRYVYWVSQFTDQGDATVEPYNGGAKGRIHRVVKEAVNANASETILVDGEAEGTVALALDGDYIYWGTLKGGATVQIRRTKRSCSAPCTPEDYVSAPAGRPISHMRRAKPGLIFAMTDEGKVFAIDTVHDQISGVAQMTTSNPGFAVLDDAAFVSWLDERDVLKIGLGTANKHAEYVGDASPIGANQITTDCTRLFALRKQDSDLWVANPKEPSSFAKYATVTQYGVFDAFADNDYVYLASPDGQGLRVVDIATHQPIQKFDGSYFRVWADSSGLYAGDHDHVAPGAIYRFGN